MKLRFNSKMRMVRPSDAFLPAGLALTSALGRSDATLRLFQFLLLTRLFSLATAPGLRQAFSLQPSMRKARGSVKTALVMQIAGPVGASVAVLALKHGALPIHLLLFIASGFLLNVEHVFYEYLFSTGDGLSSTVLRSITAALASGGLMLSGEGLLPMGLEWLCGGTLIAAILSAVVGIVIGGGLRGRLNNQVFKCAPASMLQTSIYPLSWLLLSRLIPVAPSTAIPFFAGLTLYDLCRSPFRRAPSESSVMNRILLIICSVSLILIGLCILPTTSSLSLPMYDIAAFGTALILAALCGFALYGTIKKND